MSVLGLRIVLLGLLSVFWEMLSFMHSLKRALMLIGWSLSSSLYAGLTRKRLRWKGRIPNLVQSLKYSEHSRNWCSKVQGIRRKDFCCRFDECHWNQHQVFSPDPNHQEGFTHFPSLLPKSQKIYQLSEVWPFSYLACNEFVYLVYQGRQFYKNTPLRKKESLWNWMKLLYCHTSISLYPDWLLLSWKVQQTPTHRAFRRTFRHRQNVFILPYFSSPYFTLGLSEKCKHSVFIGVSQFVFNKGMQHEIKATTTVP